MFPSATTLDCLRERLEALYATFNKRRFVHPDPLELLYRYEKPGDREIVALIASSLAYGKVEQILKSVDKILLRMGPSPFDFLRSSSFKTMHTAFEHFRHRFTPGADVSLLLWSARNTIREYGSLCECFMAGYQRSHETVLPALSVFVRHFHGDRPCCWSGFLPSPANGSACKRLNLFLRWMVRKDGVDPGGWSGIPPSKLVVPLDTHMHRIGLMLGLTRRNQADLRTAVEITEAFKSISPDDPVRYDFALTRFGIRKDMTQDRLLNLSSSFTNRPFGASITPPGDTRNPTEPDFRKSPPHGSA